MDTIAEVNRQVVDCTRCPRLVVYRQEVARTKRRMYRDEEYWGRPLPGFGDPNARVLLVGLAPAAHGGQPHRAHVHGGPKRRLAVRHAPQVRLRQSADLPSPRGRTRPGGRLCHRGIEMRSSRQ